MQVLSSQLKLFNPNLMGFYPYPKGSTCQAEDREANKTAPVVSTATIPLATEKSPRYGPMVHSPYIPVPALDISKLPMSTTQNKTIQFAAIGLRVMRGSWAVCTATSNTLAKRIAAALNEHKTNQRGI